MRRSEAWRRFQDSRIINNRLEIVKSWRGHGPNSYLEYLKEHKNKLNKFNLKCTCGMCRQDRYDRSKQKIENRKEIDSN